MIMKNTFVRFASVMMISLLMLVCTACSQGGGNNGNYPYEPDTPAPDPHAGIFASEHGTMTFSGDGESIVIDFDDTLAELTDLPQGEHEGTYVFLSGNLPPNGSFPVRYDIAHEMQITVNDKSVVMDMGTATPDGKSASSGVNTVTPEYIPMLFDGDSGFLTVEFKKNI
ncbi:MAG: hypothetical protein K6F87_00510 [Lachnospiraceae bacterium]|nr:hypothetical protein [Lachnospiraceae bacterium]